MNLRLSAPGNGIDRERALRTVMQQLERLALPGNVRELENLLHRALALSAGGDLQLDELDLTPVETAAEAPGETVRSAAIPDDTTPSDLQHWLDQQERRVILRVLRETGFNRTAAAARLGLNLRQMRYRMSRLAIVAPSSGPGDHEPS